MPDSKLTQTLNTYFHISKVKCRFLATDNQRTTVQRSAVWMFLQRTAAPADTDSLTRVTRFFRDHLQYHFISSSSYKQWKMYFF